MEEQQEIMSFVQQIMGTKKRLGYQNFKEINQTVSSEMILSVMDLLHDNLPCSANIIRMRNSFIETSEQQESEQQLFVPNEDDVGQHQDTLSPGIRKHKGSSSSFLASPCILKSYKPNSNTSTGSNEGDGPEKVQNKNFFKIRNNN
jgi:hypothetical protein